MKNLFNIKILYFYLFFLTINLHAQLDTNAPWPMFRQNSRHTGQTNDNVLGVQKNPVVKWSFGFPQSSGYSYVILGSDSTVYTTSRYKLYALTNGKKKWEYDPPNTVRSRNSPAIGADGNIYIVFDDYLHAVNPDDGLKKWECFIGGFSYASPSVSTNNTIYIGSDDDKIYAITNGAIKWTNRLGGNVMSSAAIGNDGTIYVGCNNSKLYAITNGVIKWSNKLAGQAYYSSPAIGPDNTVYIGGWHNNLYAITNGVIKWTNRLGSSIPYSSPAIGPDGTIYVGCNDHKVYAINSDGSLKWTNRLGNSIYSSPTVGSDNTVYIGCYDKKLYAITNGVIKWTNKFSSTIYYSSPAIGNDGTIYISLDSTLGVQAIIQNNAPQLVWSSNTGYSNDGVEPNNGYNGQYFRFEVKYKDRNNDEPSTNHVWIDIDDNGSYENDEKFTMYSNFGTSYSNGIIYTNLIQAFYAGDGIINYKFHFTDKYSYIPLPCAPISNHTFTVTNTNIPHQLEVTKNTDINGICDSYTNNVVMSIQIWDSKHNHYLTGFQVGNASNMILGTDFSNVQLWYDENKNYKWDINDISVASLKWNGINLWTNNNINFTTNLAFPRDFLITIDITTNAVISNSFQSFIPEKGIQCSGGTNAPLTPLTNYGAMKIGDYLKVTKTADRNNVYYNFIKGTAMVVKIKGLKQSLLKKIKIGNAGTMMPGTDISKIQLWYDSNKNNWWSTSDILAAELNWDGSSFWTNNNISFNSNLLEHNQFVITIDFAYSIKAFRTFKAYIPAYSVWDNYKKSAPTNAITNNGTLSVSEGFNGPIRPGRQYGAPTSEIGDINHDGFLDFIITGWDVPNNKYLEKYVNNKDGSFTGPTSVGAGNDRNSIAFGDINHDGFMDFIVTYAGILGKCINDGTGSFNVTYFGNGVQDSSICLGDIDNDGDMDLIASGRVAGGLDKYINDGIGNFINTSFGEGLFNTSIALGDIDNDGDLDLIVTGDDGGINKLHKYINDNSSTNFSGPYSFGTGVQFGAVSLGDIDGDGDLDLIVSGSGRLDKYINDGTGTFTGTAFGTGVSISAQALGDVDNDGDLDLIIGGRAGASTLKKYLNDGSGNFPAVNNLNSIIGWSTYRGVVVLGDLCNDGDLDLIVAGHYGFGNRRFDILYNTKSTTNLAPSAPTLLKSTNINGYWRFSWNSASDDHTSLKLLRYKIAIGTNIGSGIYNYSSTNINYPHSQANLGNICVVTALSYKSMIPVNNTVYFKVCALDTCFKHSSYSAEAIAIFPLVHNLTLPKDYGKFHYALLEARNDDHIQADPWVYNEQVNINNLTNIIIEATSWVSDKIMTNTIISGTNKQFNIKILNSKNIKLRGFTIKEATNGIVLQNCSYNYVMNNYILSNTSSGIKIDNANNNSILTNIIFNNQSGISINNSTGSTLYRNAIYHNSGNGIILNNSDNNFIINNSITSNAYGGIYDGIVFNNSGNNLIKNNIIAFTKNGYGINLNTGLGNSLIYNDVYGNISGNYNNITPGIGTITNNPLWINFNIFSTNFLSLSNFSPCIDKGDPSDPAPTIGNNRIDMGWKEFINPHLTVTLSKIITNISLNLINSAPIPGASIEYKINCKVNSYGNQNGENIIIYDNIINNISYKTDYTTTVGWTIEYSTNILPDQSYSSAQYTNQRPLKDKIKWIRWKKVSVTGGNKEFSFIAVIK